MKDTKGFGEVGISPIERIIDCGYKECSSVVCNPVSVILALKIDCVNKEK